MSKININKIAAVFTAVSSFGMYAAALPVTVSAKSTAIYPNAEMGIRVSAEKDAGKITDDAKLGSGIAKGSEEEGWTAVEAVGEGTDGRVSNRYDMGKTEVVEVGYGQSKRFALIEQYTVDNLDAAQSLEFTYVSTKKSDQSLGIWLYDGEMPTACTVNTTGAENANTIVQNLAKSYGIYSGNSAVEDATVAGASAIDPLAKSQSNVEAGEAYTITVEGEALDKIKDAAVDNTFTITVSTSNIKGDSTAKIYMNGYTAEDAEPIEENYPRVTAKYDASEVSDAPEGAVELKNQPTTSKNSKKFDIDNESYITAAATTNNTDIWYIGDYDLDVTDSFKARAIMCPGYTDGEITTTPILNFAYMDIEDGVNVDADYITENSSTIRSSARKLGYYEGYTKEAANSDDYNDFTDVEVDLTAKKSGVKHIFVYGTAQKARIYLDYITSIGMKEAAYPSGAVGVNSADTVTNYSGKLVKENISDDEYRNITDFKNNNGYIWYIGSFNTDEIQSAEISAKLTAALGLDGKSYAPSVKLGYMPKSENSVDVQYITDNSKTIRDKKNLVYEWSAETNGLEVKNVLKSEMKLPAGEEIELFVYGTTQLSYTYTDENNEEKTANAQPSLGLDYVKVNISEPSVITSVPSDDMQLRTGNTTDYRKTSVMELKAADDDKYAFTGAMKFDIANITRYISSGYKVKSAELRLTTMKQNNGTSIKAVPFTTDLSESYAKNDVLGDAYKSTVDYAIENYPSYEIGTLKSALKGKNLNDYVSVEGADTDLSKWYNTIDISAYLAGAAKSGSKELPILIYSASGEDKTGNQICTKDMENDKNWESISGFYKLNGAAVTVEDFAPTIIIELEKGTETAAPMEVLNGRMNVVTIKGGYDYKAWKCSKDIIYNGKLKPAGEDIYSLQAALEQNPETTAADYTLADFYITGAEYKIENGEANTRTNPYVDAEGNKISTEVTEYINEINISSDLLADAKVVYAVVYAADGSLKSVNSYAPSEKISVSADENGEGIAAAPGEIIKAFVWGDNQKPVYEK